MIFPFTLNNSDGLSMLGINNFQISQDSIWKPLNMKNEEDVFFHHIQSFLQKSVNGEEGKINKKKSCDLYIYSISDKDWSQNIMGKQSIFTMEYKEWKGKFFFPNDISSFESPKLIIYPDASVGILIIPIEMTNGKYKKEDTEKNLNPSTMEGLLDFNYRMHKTDKEKPKLKYQAPENLKEEHKRFFYEKMEKFSKIIGITYDKQKEEALTFELPTLVEKLLSYMGMEYKFTNLKRCHVLTYIHSNNEDDLTKEEKEDLMRISRCENHHYKIVENDNSILQTFKNIHLAVSVEGSAIMTNGSSDFIKGFKTDTFQKRYIWLYILAIIQRYSLINMSRAIGEIDDTDDKQKTVSLQRLRDLSDRLVRIKVNTCFSDVSDYKQHNDFYQFCIRKLGVTRLLRDMEQKMATLGECLKQKADKNSENLQFLLALFVAFLTIFSGCNDGFELFKNLFNVGDSHNPPILISFYWIVFGIIFLFSILMVFRFRKELWEIISDILQFWKKHN